MNQVRIAIDFSNQAVSSDEVFNDIRNGSRSANHLMESDWRLRTFGPGSQNK